MKPAFATARNTNGSPAQDWARALQLTAPIVRNPARIFPAVIGERAAQYGDAPALLSDGECLTYRQLAARVNRYARWAIAQGIGKGQCVGLLMPNCPEFMAIWLGITKAGGVVALLNTHLTGPLLAHCINIVAPQHIIAAADLRDALDTALPHLVQSPVVWSHGAGTDAFRGFDDAVLTERELPSVTIDDRALYIFTSGTTGPPKAARWYRR